MLEFEVRNKMQLRAAIIAAAQDSDALAKAVPATIRWGTTVYRFGNGISPARKRELLRNIQRSRGI